MRSDTELLDVLEAILPATHALPAADLMDPFEAACRDAGLSPSRYSNRGTGFVLNLLRALELAGRAHRKVERAEGNGVAVPVHRWLAGKAPVESATERKDRLRREARAAAPKRQERQPKFAAAAAASYLGTPQGERDPIQSKPSPVLPSRRKRTDPHYFAEARRVATDVTTALDREVPEKVLAETLERAGSHLRRIAAQVGAER